MSYDKRPSDFLVEITPEEAWQVEAEGFVMVRNGVSGHETKTWVRAVSMIEGPRVQMDASSDLYFDFPPGELVLPQQFTAQEVDCYMDADNGRALHFFGETGLLVVRSSLA